LYEAAYAGVPCVDVTIQLKGTFSYAPVSVALNAVGGAVASTTGTAGVLGSVNLFGLPVGTGEFFYSLTDPNGNLNPSLCGGARAALGPLEFGQMGLAIGCNDCITGVLEALSSFVEGLTGDIAAQAQPILYTFIEHAAAHRLNAIRSRPVTAYFGDLAGGALLTAEEQVAVLGALLNLPEVLRFLETHPGAVAEFNESAIAALAERSFALVLDIYNSVNPQLQFCGQVEPRIFGFSLTGGNTLVAARFLANKTGFAGDATFSPSYVFGNLPFFLLSGGTINNVVPALDEATMGFAFGLPVVNDATLQLLRSDPAGFASLQLDHLLANATLTFGYELSPFGFKLADGEGRVALPTIEHHPDNPLRAGGPFIRPVFPDRSTVLQAALDGGVLAFATWTGREGDLAELFPQGSPEAAAVANRELMRDYFPHGGFLGAAKVDFPKPLVAAPPFDQLAELFSPLTLTNALDRIALAQDIFTNYVIGSSNVGSLSVYVPFPRPPANFWQLQQGPQAFIDAIAASDVETLMQDGLNLFPDEFFMRGRVRAQLLGLSLAEGEMVADPAQGLFRLTMGVAGDSWLTNFVQGGVTGLVQTAEYILQTNPSQLPPGTTAADLEPEARLRAALDAIEAAAQPGASEAQRNLALSNAMARLTDTLPKVSVEAALALQLPAELSGFMRFNTGAGFHGFSPRFEPGYALPGYTGPVVYPDPDPANPGPYTLARRHGGLIAAGHFIFGFNLTDSDPNRRLVIDIPEAALGITGTENPFPSLNGRLRVNEITLPNLFAFGGSTSPGFQFRDGLLQFNSNPAVGADLIHVTGAMTPIDLGPFLRVRPVPADANPESLLGGLLRVTKTATGASMALSLNPAEATIPMFGPNLRGLIYGGISDGAFTPFSFSTIPGQDWAATVRLEGALEIRSPLDPEGPVLFRPAPQMIGSTPVPFEVAIHGSGLESFELRLTVPNGIEFTLFPGTAHESVFTTGSESATCLFVSNDGRVYFDSGSRSMDLAGLARVDGRIEFGFEPVDRTPALGRSNPANFVARLGGSLEQTITITNINTSGSLLTLDAAISGSSHFSVVPNRLLLGGGESAPLRVRFTPRTAGTFNAALVLSNNTPTPGIVVPLTGRAIVAPRMHVNVASVAFGATPLGTTKSHAIRVSNLGDTTLFLTNVAATAPFTDNRSGVVPVQAGSSTDILVSFTPLSTSSTNGLLTFTTNDPEARNGQVILTGFGSNRFWYRQRRGDGLERLRGIAMNADRNGLAVGLEGAAFNASNDGRLWRSDFFPGGTNLMATVFANAQTGWVAGARGFVYRTSDGGGTWSPVGGADVAKEGSNWRGATVLNSGAASLVVVGETEGKALIAVEDNALFTPGTIRTSAGPLNGVAFSSGKNGIAVGEGAIILRTTDGGKTWDRVAPPSSLDDQIALRAVAFNSVNPANWVIVGDNGVILQSTNEGTTWSVRGSSNATNLHAIAHATDAFYAVGDNGVIRRGLSNGALWVPDESGTRSDFRGVITRGAEAWAVTDQGDIFHRRTNAISGPIAVVNVEDLEVGQIASGQRVIREIVIANEGTTNLTADVEASGADFKVIPPPEKSVRPGCEGLFVLSFERPGGGSFGAGIQVTTSDGGAGKVDETVKVLVRGDAFEPLAYAYLPRCLDLGSLLVNSAARMQVGITNLGQAALNLHDLSVRSEDATAVSDLSASFDGPLPPGAGGLIQFLFRPTRPGLHRGQIEVSSDAVNGVAAVEFVANVVAPAQVVIIDSIPHGAPVQVNSTTVTAPTAFSIVTGIPATGQLLINSTVTAQAAPAFTADGVRYEFQRWEPGTANPLTFTAGSSVAKYVARYAQSLDATSIGEDPPRIVASPCEFTSPTDVAFGAWVKITEARLTVPWLTTPNTTAGTPFKVEGALFLSLQKAYGSLSSGRIRIQVPANSPAFPSIELLEITPGSWNFDIEPDFFRLGALSPGLQMLNASALPPTQLRMEVDVRPGSNDPHAYMRFATLDELPLMPGLFALGPSSAEVRVGLNPLQPAFRLATLGQFRALARPDGPGWILSRTNVFVLDPQFPTNSAVVFTNRQVLADLAVLRVHATNGTTIGPVYDGVRFNLAAHDLDIEFFNSGQFIRATTSIASDGTYAFSAELPETGVDAGLIRLRPRTTANRTAAITANPLQAQLAVTFPAMFLNSRSSPVLWPNDRFELPEFTFDSTDFSMRMPLPALDFADIRLEPREAVDEDNYLEFTRRPNETRIKLRNRHDLFLGALKLGFTLTHDGLSGQFSGRAGLDGPPPLDQFSDRVSLEYRSSQRPEFILNRSFLGVGFRLKLGSDLPFGEACLLDPFSNEPLRDRRETLCLP
jgi:photosystem II stability/assembly factor-like uncharacterized protein